ncbi:MAG: hypothetical protein DMF63_06175 [Acidobacteria bacterium]|nr:MAG: hypothetical protein DMF63_06175 [Acidobacteriota bacterium]
MNKTLLFGRAVKILFVMILSAGSALSQLTLNTSFSAGITDGNSNGFVSAVQADGKILVGGNFALVNGVEQFGLARLNSNGSRDATFNSAGSGPNGGVFEIKILGTGKILIGGNFTTYNGTNISGVARLNADGTLDATFNTGGTGATGAVRSIAIQTDGKYLISGQNLSAYNGTAKFSIIRINADGTLDASFTSPFAAPAPFVEQPALQSDGKIIIGGTFTVGNYNNLARLTTTGAVDTTFNGGSTGMNGGVYAVLVLGDNRILAGGDFTAIYGAGRPGLARLNADGTMDNTFNPPALSLSHVEYIALKPNGQYFVAGEFIGDGQYPVGLLNTDGTIDAVFNQPEADNTGYHVALQADGKILVTGWFNTTEALGNLSNRNLLRLNADGTRDLSFTVSLSAFASVGSMLQQPDGKYVIAGNFTFANGTSHANIVRFNSNGTLDNTFQSGYGIWSINNVGTNAVAQQADGKILLGGYFFEYNLDDARSLVRLNSDGTRDATFSTLGIQAGDPSINDLLVLPDGKIMVAGAGLDIGFQTLVRLNTNGTGDAGFIPGNGNGNMQKVLRQPDGKLIVVGNFTSYLAQARSRIVRLNADGSLDGTFNIGTGANNQISTATLLADGKILIGGFFTSFNGTTRNRIARLNSDGSVDTGFNPIAGANGSVAAIVVQQDGKYVISGGFTTYDGVTRVRLARINANGSLDPSADSGIVNDIRFGIRRLMLTADNEILVGGTFTTYGAVARDGIAKLRSALTVRAPFDFDGDGKTDIGIFRPVAGASEWWINRSGNGITFALQFGSSTDKITPADYTGDGKTDIAFFRPNSGQWFVLRSEDFSFFALPFGTNGDVPVPADYDADGKADFAVFRPSSSTWFLSQSSGAPTRIFQFGISGDVPVVADYDADGKADVGIFRQAAGGAEWWIDRSTAGVLAIQFGANTDKAVQGDYTGDGKTDVAIWRPSTGEWFIVRSEDFSFYGFPFGTNGDVVAPGDYDGDGKFDVTVFRPSTATWFISRTTAGTQIVQFGANGDRPLPNAFVP